MWFVSCLCSASVLLRQAEVLAATYPNTIPAMLDATSQEGHLDSLVKDHDLVIRYSRRCSDDMQTFKHTVKRVTLRVEGFILIYSKNTTVPQGEYNVLLIPTPSLQPKSIPPSSQWVPFYQAKVYPFIQPKCIPPSSQSVSLHLVKVYYSI